LWSFVVEGYYLDPLESVVNALFGFPGLDLGTVIIFALFLGVALYINFFYKKGNFFQHIAKNTAEILGLGLISLYIISIFTSGFSAYGSISSATSAIELKTSELAFVSLQKIIIILVFLFLIIRKVKERTKREKIAYWKPIFDLIQFVIFNIYLIFTIISIVIGIYAFFYDVNYYFFTLSC